MKMLVLGAGLQGSACAYNLLQDNRIETVTLADLHPGELPEFLSPWRGENGTTNGILYEYWTNCFITRLAVLPPG